MSHDGNPSQDHRPLAPKPAHVPETLVYDFDMFRDPALIADPHGRVLDLVANAPPIFWTPRNGGYWLVTSHEAVFEAARATEIFSSEIIPRAMMHAMLAQMPPGTPRIPNLVPIFLDPPAHAAYRMPLASVFSPKTINALQGEIRAAARELVGRVAGQGGCEFMSAVAEPLPVQVFLKMMGLPLERMQEYRTLVGEQMAAAADPPAKAIQRSFRIVASMRDVIQARKEAPQDDLISLLWRIEIEGRPTTQEDVEDFAFLLFMAGLETVMLAMGFAARHLAGDAALQDRLRADPSLIVHAKEEMLRRYTFIAPPRRVAQDVVFQGVEMKKDDRAILFLPGADLDGARFPDPGRFDADREDTAHIAFNAGPHRCLGSHLARLELQILYEELLAGLPSFRLDPARPPVFHGGQNLGISSLHLVW
jgi:cytochrome P450